MKPISFCINTSRNEREYLLLLLNSLKENTQIENHEVLIFIDSDLFYVFKNKHNIKYIRLALCKLFKNS